MTKKDRSPDARFNKADPGKIERDAALKAVTDNMAKLRALRLAREATEQSKLPATVKKARAKSKKPGEKGPALADWLASQQGGGRRT